MSFLMINGVCCLCKRVGEGIEVIYALTAWEFYTVSRGLL